LLIVLDDGPSVVIYVFVVVVLGALLVILLRARKESLNTAPNVPV
jgi:hypothetical protein